MAEKNVIKLTESELKEIVKESVSKALDSISEEPIRVEDFFDVASLSKRDVQQMATDLRVFLQGRAYCSDLSDEGELILKEGSSIVTPIKQLRKELKTLGFKQWQIKSVIVCNKVRVVILYADIAQNTKVIENKMLSCGWTMAHVSPPTLLYGVPVRVMDFDPEEQRPITKEARRYQYLYHWTPYKNVKSILQNGIEARSENDYLSYPPKAHLMKGDISKIDASRFGWQLFNNNKSLRNGRYALIRVYMKSVPPIIDFYGDPRFKDGYFTKDTIPAQALELFGDIYYSDKFNYHNEQLNVIIPNDTMI